MGCLNFNRRLLMGCLFLLLNSCSLFGDDYKNINAKGIARHNLSVIKYCSTFSDDFLYVDDKTFTSKKDIFLLINEMNRSISQYRICLNNLEEYNIKVIKV